MRGSSVENYSVVAKQINMNSVYYCEFQEVGHLIRIISAGYHYDEGPVYFRLLVSVYGLLKIESRCAFLHLFAFDTTIYREDQRK